MSDRKMPLGPTRPGDADSRTVQSLEGGTDLRQHTIVATSLNGDKDLEKTLPDSKLCECLRDGGAERDTFVFACPGVVDVVRRSPIPRVHSAHPACCGPHRRPAHPRLPCPLRRPRTTRPRPTRGSSRPTSVSTLPPTASAASR